MCRGQKSRVGGSLLRAFLAVDLPLPAGSCGADLEGFAPDIDHVLAAAQRSSGSFSSVIHPRSMKKTISIPNTNV